MTLSPEAALSVLLPINIDRRDSPHDIPLSPAESVESIDVQSDDENDREVVDKRLSRYDPTTSLSVGPIVRPQLSCPDFALGTARAMKARLKEPPPPVPGVPAFHLQQPLQTPHIQGQSAIEEAANASPQSSARQRNAFLPLQSVNKCPWDESFREEKTPPRKRHGMFFGRLHSFNLEPPSQYRQSRFLTSFDDLFHPDLPSSQRYHFIEETHPEGEELRERIRQGMEDSIIPSPQATPVKTERVPLKERIRSLINIERPKKRRRFWWENIVGKKRRLPPRPNEDYL